MKKILFFLVIASILAACASKDKKDETKAAVEERTTPQTSTDSTTKPMVETGIKGNPLTDPKSILSKRAVYFDFDSYVVKDEYKSLIQAHAKYLTENRAAKVAIQGNTDERGSREYNLALGQRRADSVKKMMSLLGAQDNQIEAVSFGEEKPKATAASESAWAENRRADLVYAGE
jgi:peptidoglycan-associated lipoprotein